MKPASAQRDALGLAPLRSDVKTRHDVTLRGSDGAARRTTVRLASGFAAAERTASPLRIASVNDLMPVAGEIQVDRNSANPATWGQPAVVVHDQALRKPKLLSAQLRTSQAPGQTTWRGRYALLQQSISRANDETVLALDVDLARTVWLCAIRPLTVATARTRVRGASLVQASLSSRMAEIQHLAALSHPALPAIYEAWIDEETIWAAVEKIDGSTLEQFLKTQVKTRQDALLRIAWQTATAVRELARVNIDYYLCSANSLLVVDGGQPRLADLFGQSLADNASPLPNLHQSSPSWSRRRPTHARPRELALRVLCEIFAEICDQQGRELRRERPTFGTWQRRSLAATAEFFRTWSRCDTLVNDQTWDRFLDELAQLRRQQKGKRRRFGAGVALCVGLAGATVWAQHSTYEQCDEIPLTWSHAWSPDRRSAMIDAALPGQREIAQRLADYLDEEGQRWLDIHRTSCEKPERSMSDQHRRLQEQCLSQWANDVKHVTELATTGDLQKALDWLPSLDGNVRCQEVPTTDHRLATVATRDRTSYQHFAAQLHRVEQLRLAGEHAVAAILMPTLQVNNLSFLPLNAEARLLGALLNDSARGRAALREGADQARLLALAANEDTIEARATTLSIFNFDSEARDYESWNEAWHHAKAALARVEAATKAPLPRAELYYQLGASAAMFGRIDLARQGFERAVELIGETTPYGRERLTVNMLAGVGYFHFLRGEVHESEHYVERALILALRRYGPTHALSIQPLGNATLVDAYSGRMRRALERADLLVRIFYNQLINDEAIVTSLIEDPLAVYLAAGHCTSAHRLLDAAAPGGEPRSRFRLHERQRLLAAILKVSRICGLVVAPRVAAELEARSIDWTTPTHDNVPVVMEWYLYRANQSGGDAEIDAAIRALSSVVSAHVHQEHLWQHELDLLRARQHAAHDRTDQAAATLRYDLERIDRIYGPQSILGVDTLIHIAEVERARGDFRQGHNAARQAVDRLVAQLGPDSPRLLATYAWLAPLSLVLGEREQALTYAQEARRLANLEEVPQTLRLAVLGSESSVSPKTIKGRSSSSSPVSR